MTFEEVSAKSGFNVTEVFVEMAKMIKKQRGGFEAVSQGGGDSVNLNDSKSGDKKKCACW